jgi:hypothetical protein
MFFSRVHPPAVAIRCRTAPSPNLVATAGSLLALPRESGQFVAVFSRGRPSLIRIPGNRIRVAAAQRVPGPVRGARGNSPAPGSTGSGVRQPCRVAAAATRPSSSPSGAARPPLPSSRGGRNGTGTQRSAQPWRSRSCPVGAVRRRQRERPERPERPGHQERRDRCRRARGTTRAMEAGQPRQRTGGSGADQPDSVKEPGQPIDGNRART